MFTLKIELLCCFISFQVLHYISAISKSLGNVEKILGPFGDFIIQLESSKLSLIPSKLLESNESGHDDEYYELSEDYTTANESSGEDSSHFRGKGAMNNNA